MVQDINRVRADLQLSCAIVEALRWRNPSLFDVVALEDYLARGSPVASRETRGFVPFLPSVPLENSRTEKSRRSPIHADFWMKCRRKAHQCLTFIFCITFAAHLRHLLR